MSARCFEHQHMGTSEFAVYAYALRVAHGSGIFYGDGRTIAQAFLNTSKDKIYRALKCLVRDGWLETLTPSVRQRNGVFSCARYRVVSHEEFVRTHGCGNCVTSAEIGQHDFGSETGEPVAQARQASRENTVDLSQNQAQPVAPVRQKVEKEKLEKEKLKGQWDFLNDKNHQAKMQKLITELADKKAMDEQIYLRREQDLEAQRILWKKAVERQAETQLPEPAKRVV